MYDTDNLVMIVHSIDTEGPLRESVEATFERLHHLLGIEGLPQTKETLNRLKQKAIPLDGKEDLVAQLLSEHSLSYKNSWEEIDAMLDCIMDPAFRMALPDSFGNGWIYNWHCLDHVGFETNPRERDLGYHKIFDHYRKRLTSQPNCQDALHYHFHYISTYREAHKCATSFLNSAPEFLEVLCRRIIERGWFPQVARAGFQAERPDMHWFLEQWVPYDLSNMALDDNSVLDNLTDFRNGRSGNWRKSPSDWSVYHPSHDDYQVPGNCRRWIGRALNVLSRTGTLTEEEVEKAFARASEGKPTILGISGHDWRNLGTEVDFVRSVIEKVAPKHSNVKFAYCEAVDAFRKATNAPVDAKPLTLKVTLNATPANDVPNLDIKTVRGTVFGPQPFLAIETMAGRFIHDNLDFSTKNGVWHYAFHSDTLPLADVRSIGIAANDAQANVSLTVLERDGAGVFHEKKASDF